MALQSSIISHGLASILTSPTMDTESISSRETESISSRDTESISSRESIQTIIADIKTNDKSKNVEK